MTLKAVLLPVCFASMLSVPVNADPIRDDLRLGQGEAAVSASAPVLPVSRNDTLLVSQVGTELWSWTQDAEVVGDYAFCAAYYGLLVLDVSNPAEPTVVSRLYCPGYSVYHPVPNIAERDIDVVGNYAFMTAPCEGLRIIDISNPADPVLIGHYDVADSCEAQWEIEVKGDYVYAVSDRGLIVLDISVLTDPEPVAMASTSEYPHTLATSGNALFVGSDLGFDVIDITNPLDPQYLTTYPIPCLKIQVKNDYAYIAGEDAQLIIADISTPLTPQFIDTIPSVGAIRTAFVYGDYLYLGVDSGSVTGFGDAAYNSLDIFDLTNPSAPLSVNQPSFTFSGVNISAVDSQMCLIGWDGIKFLDIGDPANPIPLGGYGPQVGPSIGVAGDYAYFPGRDTLYVLDITNPADPVIISRNRLDSSFYASQTRVLGDYAYLNGSYLSYPSAGIWIMDISDPNFPHTAGEYVCRFASFAVRDSIIYGIGSGPGHDSLIVVNVADPASPVEIGSYYWGNWGSFTGIRVDGQYAYIAATTDLEQLPGLLIIGISDPAAPDSIGSYFDAGPGSDMTGDIEIRDTCVYVWGCASVINVADPANPVVIPGSSMPPYSVSSTPRLAIADNALIFVSTLLGDGTYLISDISDPAHPSTGNLYTTVGFPSDVATQGGYVFIPETVGLSILSTSLYSTDGKYFVTSLSDDGVGSLRLAIDSANNHPGADTVLFEISGTIGLASALPAISDDSTVIAGASAPGGMYSVIIDGSGVIGGDGLTLQSSKNVIEGLTIIEFPDNGIVVEGAASVGNVLTNNLIYDNGGLAIDLGGDGVTVNDIGDIDTGPNDLLNYPVIDSINSQLDGTFIIYGQAAHDATIELYVAHPAKDDLRPPDPSGHGEAYEFIGTTTTSPIGEFSYPTDQNLLMFSAVTCIVTDPSGNTSEMSENFLLLPRPLVIVATTFTPGKSGLLPQNGVNLIVKDPDGDTIGLDENNVLIDQIPGAEYIVTANDDDSVYIPEPLVGDYDIAFIPEAGGGTGSMYAGIIRVDGSQQVVISIDDIPSTGEFNSVNYTYDEGCDYVNGDANGDGNINIGDAVYVISYIFKGGPAPEPPASADADCDSHVNIADPVYVINYIFKGGPPPCAF